MYAKTWSNKNILEQHFEQIKAESLRKFYTTSFRP